MKLIGVPMGGNVIRVHRASCRDIPEDARSSGRTLGYDDVYHIEAESRGEAISELPSGSDVEFVGCARLRRGAR